MFYSLMCLLLSGDIEMNPGPSTTSDSSVNDTFEFLQLRELVTFSCINVQSVQPKLDILEAEMGDRDIILITETWLKPTVPNSSVMLENFKEPFRNDRTGDRVDGGVMIYVRNSLPSKRRNDLELQTINIHMHI